MIPPEMPPTRRTFLTSSCGLLVLGPAALVADEKPISPLVRAVQLAKLAKIEYAKVRDYSCTLIKREKVRGKLSPNHIISLRARSNPFSVAMRWSEPSDIAGQQCIYVAGQNNGKMRVKGSGLLGAIGFISLATDDARARKNSKHCITEAGIGNVIKRCLAAWDTPKHNKAAIKIGTYSFNKRLCTRVETTNANKNTKGGYYKSVVYFDRETALPVRVENYDWPVNGKPAELCESFSYLNMKLNVGLPDSVFDK